MSRVPTYKKQVLFENRYEILHSTVTFLAGEETISYNPRASLFYGTRLYPPSDKSLVNKIISIKEKVGDSFVDNGNADGVSVTSIGIYNAAYSGAELVGVSRTGSIDTEKSYNIQFYFYYNYYSTHTVFKVKHNGTEYNEIKLNGKIITPKA